MNKRLSAGTAAPPRIARQAALNRVGEPRAAPIKSHAPLVPVDTAAGRALVGVIVILTFLAALCASAAELVAESSAQWNSSVGREATVQVRPSPQRDIDADLAQVAETARRAAGISTATILGKDDAERLLEPWLGSGLDLGSLPVPRLVVLKLEEGARPDFGELRRRLASRVPGASLDDHGAWLSRLSVMAYTIVAVGLALVVLVLVATALAVAFATHGAMAGNREVVEVLHFVGADDAFIAREFQRRFFRLGLKGGLIGGGLAIATIVALGVLSSSWRAGPAGDQLEAMFGTFEVGQRGFAAVVLIALLVSMITAVVSRLAVKHFLTRST
jgi:cell division transport system permease protein